MFIYSLDIVSAQSKINNPNKHKKKKLFVFFLYALTSIYVLYTGFSVYIRIHQYWLSQHRVRVIPEIFLKIPYPLSTVPHRVTKI